MVKALMGKAFRAAALLAVTMLAGCGWFSGKDENATYVEQPVDQLYNRALDDLGAENYKQAAKEFEEVDRQHPYSVWATKAQVMAAFTYYLKSLCFYEQISDVGRDQGITQKALDSLAEVVKRFPDSPYARDTRLKVELTIDHLAGKEMDIGRYYQKQQQYIGAINRYRVVIERYQTTTHVPEALHRLVESYMALGVKSEAKEAAAVLGHNFPGSDWYADSYFILTGEDFRIDDK